MVAGPFILDFPMRSLSPTNICDTTLASKERTAKPTKHICLAVQLKRGRSWRRRWKCAAVKASGGSLPLGSTLLVACAKVVLPGGMLLPPPEVRFSVVGIWDEDLQEAAKRCKTKIEELVAMPLGSSESSSQPSLWRHFGGEDLYDTS